MCEILISRLDVNGGQSSTVSNAGFHLSKRFPETKKGCNFPVIGNVYVWWGF